MEELELSSEERLRRRSLVNNTRKMICGVLEIISQDEISLMTTYRDFNLQICFSESHPLMVFNLIREIDPTKEFAVFRSNNVNLTSLLGIHCVNEYYNWYCFRSTHWLDTEIGQTRFLEILDRCVDEAIKGYHKLAS